MLRALDWQKPLCVCVCVCVCVLPVSRGFYQYCELQQALVTDTQILLHMIRACECVLCNRAGVMSCKYLWDTESDTKLPQVCVCVCVCVSQVQREICVYWLTDPLYKQIEKVINAAADGPVAVLFY